MKNFLFIVSEIKSFSFNSIVFLSGGAICILCFIISLVLCMAKRGYTIKKRSVFLLVYLAVLIFEYAIFYGQAEVVFCYLTLFFVVAFCMPIFYIRVRKKKEIFNSKQLELARIFDNALRVDNKAKLTLGEKMEDRQENEIIVSSNVKKPMEKVEQKTDFSHVLNIIKRLNAMQLSPYDKKKVIEIQSLILLAKKQPLDKEAKERINSGLGALIKIVAKYQSYTNYN